MRSLFFFLIILTVFSSCNTSNEFQKSEMVFDEVFNKDSISFSFDSTLIFQDLDYSSNTIVFLKNQDGHENEIVILDFSGKEIYSYDWDQSLYGEIIAPVKINDSNSIFCLGSKKFVTMDLKLNEFVSYPLENFKSSKNIDFEILNKDGSILFPNFSKRNKYIRNHKIFGKLKLFTKLNLENGKFEDIVSFPELSLFNDGKTYTSNLWNPSFFHTDSLFYVIYSIDPTIYAYNIIDFSKEILSIPLQLNDFDQLDKISSSFYDYQIFRGKILDVFKFQDHFLVSYNKSLDVPVNVYRDKSTEELNLYLRNVSKNREVFFSLFDYSGKLLYDFKIDDFDSKSLFTNESELFSIKINSSLFCLYRYSLKM